MRVRVHKHRGRDRSVRPCRCWLILTPDHSGPKLMATSECVLLRDVEFDGVQSWQSGWAYGELVWTKDCERWPTKKPGIPQLDVGEVERSPSLLEAPSSGWERLRFVPNVGFGIGSDRNEAARNIVRAVPWMILTLYHDGIIRS